MKLPADYHIHTVRCGHASGSLEEYLKSAQKLGLREVGFSDHLPLYFLPKDKREDGLAMDESEVEAYFEDIRQARIAFPDLTVKLGIEADYIPGQEDQLSAVLKELPLDYVLGSVHYIDGWGFDNPDYIDEYGNRDIDRLYRRYFELLKEAALSGIFDILAHPDLVKKFCYFPAGDMTEIYEDTVQAIKKSNVCIEVNTAGLRVPAREIYPAEGFLRLCCQYGVPVTLGSDAHKPEQVGQNFIEAVSLLKKVGYRETVIFNERQREIVSLEK